MESTRSQNITVSWRRSASGVGGATGAASPCAGETSGVAGSGTGEAVARCAGRPTSPDQHSALFIHGQLFGVDQVFFEVFQVSSSSCNWRLRTR